jgi:hypothetical protein
MSLLSPNIGYKLGFLVRQNWWLAWCLAVAYCAGAVGYASLMRCDSYPAILFLPLTIGVPIFFSKSIALYFAKPTWKRKHILVPLVQAGIAMQALCFMQVYVAEHHIGEGIDVRFVYSLTYLLTLCAIDTATLYIAGALNKRTLWLFGAINLVITLWLSQFLVYCTNY